MLLNETLQRLRELRLPGMTGALEEQVTKSACAALGFEADFALLVDREARPRSRIGRSRSPECAGGASID